MTSYLRYIFGGSHSRDSSPGGDQSSKSHWRSRTQPPSNYIYAAPGTTGTSAPTAPPRLKTKRSNSYSARTTTPSPLRFAAYETAAKASSSTAEVRYGTPPKVERSPLYRRASYKSSEHLANYAMHAPSVAPSLSFGPSSRTSSSSSILPGMARPGSSGGSSSQHVRYERRPSLRHNPAWQGSVSSATGSGHSYAGSMDPHVVRPSSLHMHPLFASTRLHSAPISYDVTYTPSSRTVLDRTTHTAVPAHTLAQPATDPPTPASSRIVLRSDKFPWPVIVGPSSSSPSGSGFYVGSSPTKSRSANVTNLDLLYSLHTTLLTRVTPQEWESLGHGSRAQRKVTRAYEKRCSKMGGGWDGGVRRLDWLHGKTRLIGIEVEKHANGVKTGKLVFGKA
ncbi:hypothetical protein PAXRUDRAFT_136803 [Paxillus rubicundulus Ve08.2h10]|uniref:DUF6699 domain-containing protein n=1 Tax=Paxillus rubicundulus Ve08.2h10 TaxID=930991 RepID=A0A0D0E6P7_9AGAM|nr:hypothetical protein PAXRUDRAFT_136803 [Paxillus rubicundulus Ve08.2h10]